MLRKLFFNYKLKIEIKTTPETSFFSFLLQILKNDVWSDGT